MKSSDPYERETISERLRPAKISILIQPRILQAIFAFLAFCSSSLAENWEQTLSKDPAGNFPELRPLRASYRFGWSGFTAATGDVHFTKPSENKFQLEGTGRTIGFVRALVCAVRHLLAVLFLGTRKTETLLDVASSCF
jgi:hypothetical protein